MRRVFTGLLGAALMAGALVTIWEVLSSGYYFGFDTSPVNDNYPFIHLISQLVGTHAAITVSLMMGVLACWIGVALLFLASRDRRREARRSLR
jgi:hypothetical protein